MLEPCQRCFYPIMANYYGSLEAVDCRIHSVRYDMVLESRAGGRLRWPHQVTYDVAATPIHPNNA
eukprot:scaffold28821_cov67-Skeletonema_dohrnii-CCMP3373.AAC.2